MVCPYCNFKNASNALVCNQCGIILRLGRTSRFVPQGGGQGGGGFAFMRGLFPGNRLKGQHAALQTRVEELVKEIEERSEEDLKKPERAQSARLALGALHLLQGEVEKSVQWLQQARQAGSAEVEFFNNAGVALARRGSVPQATEMLDQAVRVSPNIVLPMPTSRIFFPRPDWNLIPRGPWPRWARFSARWRWSRRIRRCIIVLA